MFVAYFVQIGLSITKISARGRDVSNLANSINECILVYKYICEVCMKNLKFNLSTYLCLLYKNH